MSVTDAGKSDDRAQQSLADIKSIREAKGLTLKDICEVTRVSMTHLQAIENEEFHLLPPPVYSKSFIKKYADAVGVESSVLMSRYEKFLNASKIPLEPNNEHQEKRFSGNVLYLGAGICLAIIIGVVLLIISLSPQSNIEETQLPVIESKESAVSVITPSSSGTTIPDNKGPVLPVDPGDVGKTDPVQSTANKIVPSVKDEHSNTVQTVKKMPGSESDIQNWDTKSYTLIVQAKELTWLRITGDKERPYDVILKPDEKIERHATGRFLVDIGNAGGVDIVFQGKSLGALGKQGEVIHLTLPQP